jgi:hypothetical protein
MVCDAVPGRVEIVLISADQPSSLLVSTSPICRRGGGLDQFPTSQFPTTQVPTTLGEEAPMKKIAVRRAGSVRLTAPCGCCYSAFNF